MKTLMTVGTRDHMAMRHALERSWDRFTFRDIVVFTDNPLYFTDLPNVNFQYIAPFDDGRLIDVWALTVLPRMMPELCAEHIIHVHWDGFVINGAAYRTEWDQYNFIGAPFCDNGIVGNNGFCKTDQKYWSEIAKLNLPPTIEACWPSDRLISQDRWTNNFRGVDYDKPGYRSRMDIKIAPPGLAKMFSVDKGNEYSGSFGFHGVERLVDIVRLGLY